MFSPSDRPEEQVPSANLNKVEAEQSLAFLVDLLLNLETQNSSESSVLDSEPGTSGNEDVTHSSMANKSVANTDTLVAKLGAVSPSQFVNQSAKPVLPQQTQSPKPPAPKPQQRPFPSVQPQQHSGLNPGQTDFSHRAQQDIRFILNRLEEKITRLERKVDEPTELINPLLPLIKELLWLKRTESNHSLLQALVPIIDEAIQLRSQQDKAKIGAAIGEILPEAIACEIARSPSTIAKAIAPEVALALQEQSRLDPDAVAQSLGPQMGAAIKTQIVVERESMVDALYPVIGSTISKYMVDLVKSINDKVEESLSPQSILRKLRARLKGVSEAELILRESLGFQIQAVLLIHKTSGLVIRDLQPVSSFQIEADMLAGMLTAIRSFVSECMIQPDTDSELHEIEYDTSKIILEVAGYCYLAVVVKGEPSQTFIKTIRNTLAKIILKAGKTIANYAGEPATVPASVDLCLDKLLQAEPKPTSKPKQPVGLWVLLGLILLPLGFVAYRGYVAQQIEAKVAAALDNVPELSVYRLIPKLQAGQLILTGRLPTPYLRQKAETVADQVAGDLPLRNDILTVEAPPDPTATAGEVDRVAWIFNQKPGVAIVAKHQFGEGTVNVTGVVSQMQDSLQLTQALQKIPGVDSVTNTVQIRPMLETQIYFDVNSTQVDVADNLTQLTAIRQFLDQNPGVVLKIIGYSDSTGEQGYNQQLSLERSRNVQQFLIDQGISPARLQIETSQTLPPNITTQQPLQFSRIVRFEVVIPAKE